jgi:hypothetical protein
MSIPLREFGKIGVQISALGLGGHHLGAKDEKTAIEIVHRALDGGITFTTMPGSTIAANRVLARPGPQRPARQSLRHDQGLHSRSRRFARHAQLPQKVPFVWFRENRRLSGSTLTILFRRLTFIRHV